MSDVVEEAATPAVTYKPFCSIEHNRAYSAISTDGWWTKPLGNCLYCGAPTEIRRAIPAGE